MKKSKTVPAVVLLAAGSGDPELLSVQGAALLDQADVVICDPEVSSLIAGRDVEVLDVATAPTDAAAVARHWPNRPVPDSTRCGSTQATRCSTAGCWPKPKRCIVPGSPSRSPRVPATSRALPPTPGSVWSVPGPSDCTSWTCWPAMSTSRPWRTRHPRW